ncbi:STM4015 family protein [Streptosporangium sp. NBC_01810]|uniref:STM4015 family protein n=1 Tax=Streptosporangium sp. NBC_01810 TaxID=2975951 RepID=UPI002DD8118E|nr:STM4015 family protein [Streptosporangium sp. NBC_01810]WSA28029.1 STM4015 family protein [Streptosporangium sp. NBC_01810]
MDHSEFNDDVDGLYRGEYAGLPIVSLRPPGAPMPAAGEAAWRLSVRVYDAKETFEEHFARFVATVDTTEVKAIIVGGWGEAYENDASGPIRLLAENAARLPALRSLFLGAMPSEECEISWIQQGDVTPLLEAFPLLERLEVRGGTGLELRPIRHDSLRILRFETGGLPPAVARAVGESDFPALEYLELWLGSENYGGDTTVADLEPILSGERLPALRHLGLQDSEIQDEVAAAVASAPVVARLESLAQSMGTLTDMGAEALLSGRSLTHLRRLDLHHHFLSDAMVERLRTTFSGVELDVSEQEKPDDDWYYVAVSE